MDTSRKEEIRTGCWNDFTKHASDKKFWSEEGRWNGWHCYYPFYSVSLYLKPKCSYCIDCYTVERELKVWGFFESESNITLSFTEFSNKLIETPMITELYFNYVPWPVRYTINTMVTLSLYVIRLIASI